MAVDRKRSPEERFGAQLKLAKLPRNPSPTRIRNRCELTGRPRGRVPQIQAFSHCAARARLVGRLARHGEVELVTGDRSHAMSDPLGDLLTRIRNGQPARHGPFGRRPRRCAPMCSKCCSAKAISAASEEELRAGVRSSTIELKYVDGEPVIREI